MFKIETGGNKLLKIVFADRRPMEGEALEIIRRAGNLVPSESSDVPGLLEEVKDADIIVSGMRSVPSQVIRGTGQLKGIVVYGIGYNHIDVDAATRKGVYVANTPGVNAISVAELAFGLMICLMRNIPQSYVAARGGMWKDDSIRWKLQGQELYDKVLGIVGLGNIGTQIASRARAFGMHILSYTHHPSKERAEKHGVKFVDLSTLLKQSDIVLLCCAITPETQGLIGEKELDLMKSTAYLINVARGALVKEDVLYEALKTKKIAGAALDVLQKEPPGKFNPLFELDNCVVTTHLGGRCDEAAERLLCTVAEEILRILSAQEPVNLVNPEVRDWRST